MGCGKKLKSLSRRKICKFSSFHLLIVLCEKAEYGVCWIYMTRQVDVVWRHMYSRQDYAYTSSQNLPTLFNNTQLIAELGTSERPELVSLQ